MSILNQVMGAAGAASSGAVNYVEDVFSTYLYKDNSLATQTITNGIDLAGKGGLVWQKARSGVGYNNILFDTASGINKYLVSNSSASQATVSGNSALSTGFVTSQNAGYVNCDGLNFVSWTFRKQPKFFDVVTFSGDSANGRQIAHNLGSAPGCIIVKNLTSADEWLVWHRSLGDFGGSGKNLVLNSTASVDTGGYFGTTSTQTSTYFTVNANVTKINSSGKNYVAYLFAHDAGGFGPLGTDNVISCGSWTNTGSNVTINLGYEPQYIMIKASGTTSDWYVWDTMRGLVVDGSSGTGDKSLYPNLSSAEVGSYGIDPTATGFIASGGWTATTWIYIAIRRPMKPPTTGTSVFSLIARAGTGANATVTGVGFAPDLIVTRQYTDNNNTGFFSRLIGPSQHLKSNSSDTAITNTTALLSFDMDGMSVGPVSTSEFVINRGEGNYINWFFRRAPGFFDVVCYTGTGVAKTETHNLGVAPELMIVKQRDSVRDWAVYTSATASTNFLYLNTTATSGASSSMWNNTAPTSSVFTVGTNIRTNVSSGTYAAYLFATVAGVSKVGSYTGNGSSQTIACGFAAGARFVMIKRTDVIGDWYVWDTARGIIAGNDPHLSFNTNAFMVTTNDTIDPDSSGFIVNQVAATNVNVSAATYIFLAIA